MRRRRPIPIMERETAVFIELAGRTVPVGTLWTRTRGARQTASFAYADSWLARPEAFGIDPSLPPARGPFHTDRPLFNAFTDPAPDRWGQNLMRRNERRQALLEGRQPRTLQEIDYLTLVDDRTRLGALRFRAAGGGEFLTTTDRRQARRVAFMSALTALEASDHELRSYLEIAEFLRREGSAVNQDLRQLWRRIAVNVLISNTDDHLRNHGFLRAPHGWRLAPAYDLNHVPVDVTPRVHALAIDEFDGTASLETALAAAPQFGMTHQAARAAMAEVGRAVRGWREAAARHGLTDARSRVNRSSSANRNGASNAL